MEVLHRTEHGAQGTLQGRQMTGATWGPLWSAHDSKHAIRRHGWSLAWQWNPEQRCWHAVISTRHPPFSALERRLLKRFDLFYREGHDLHVRAWATIVASRMDPNMVSP